MTKIRKIVLATAAVAALGAAGSAFTAGIGTFPTAKTTAYGETAISGATATGVTYNYSPDNSHVLSVDVVFTGDLDQDDFSGTFSGSGGVIETVEGVPGTGGASTTVNFPASGGTAVSTAALVKFGVLVTTP
jgi:hypothetical protein